MRLDIPYSTDLRQLLAREAGDYEVALQLGSYRFGGMGLDLPKALKRDKQYSAHWLPDLFTYRDLFWQPSFLPNLDAWSAKFSFFISYCQEQVEALQQADTSSGYLYADILRHMNVRAEQVRQRLVQLDKSIQRMRIVAAFRQEMYPFLDFFLTHPQTSSDAKHHAYRRLNYMIRLLMEEFQVRHESFVSATWQLSLKSPNTPAPKQAASKAVRKSSN